MTKLAARHFNVPVSIVSIVDTDRIWFKSHHGMDVDEIGRDPGLCASAILGDEPWVVENAAVDPRTMANPLVAGEMGLRFYAGAPLTTRDGFRLGTLCVIDQQPRQFSEDDVDILADLADVVMDELELRLAARATVDQELVLREQAEQMACQLQASLLPPTLPEIVGIELASLYRPAEAGQVGGDFFDVFEINDMCVLAVGDVSGKGTAAAAVTGLARHTIRSAALWAQGPGEILDNLSRSMLLGRVGADIDYFCTVLLMFARRRGQRLTIEVASAGHPPALIVARGWHLLRSRRVGTSRGLVSRGRLRGEDRGTWSRRSNLAVHRRTHRGPRNQRTGRCGRRRRADRGSRDRTTHDRRVGRRPRG